MTPDEAEGLAAQIRSVTTDEVSVASDHHELFVEVRTERGVFTMWDEADWDWLRPKIIGSEPPG